MKLDHILVPVDFSNNSQLAIDCAVALQAKFPAQITLLHAVEPFFGYGLEISPAADVEAARERAAGKRLLELAAGLPGGSPAKSVCLAGKPWEVICEWASQNQVDLIIMPTHGYSGIRHLWSGSTAERVVQKALCPVLTVRGGEG